jgi:hypothetical protein
VTDGGYGADSHREFLQVLLGQGRNPSVGRSTYNKLEYVKNRWVDHMNLGWDRVPEMAKLDCLSKELVAEYEKES